MTHDPFAVGYNTGMKLHLKALLCIVALMAVFAFVVNFPIGIIFGPEEKAPPQIPFDEATWKNAKYDYQKHIESDIRGQMTDDLFKRYKFDGWTREQVIALLGESDSLGELEGEWDLIYGLGRIPGAFAIDLQNYGFKLDRQGRVREHGFFIH